MGGPRLTHFLTGVAAAGFPEDALKGEGETEGGLVVGWGNLEERGLRGGGGPSGESGVCRVGPLPWGSPSRRTHLAAGHVRAGRGPRGEHVEPVLDLAAVLRAVVHAAVDPGLVGLKGNGEGAGSQGIIW